MDEVKPRESQEKEINDESLLSKVCFFFLLDGWCNRRDMQFAGVTKGINQDESLLSVLVFSFCETRPVAGEGSTKSNRFRPWPLFQLSIILLWTSGERIAANLVDRHPPCIAFV